MCGIFVASNLRDLQRLKELNSLRGQWCISLTALKHTPKSGFNIFASIQAKDPHAIDIVEDLSKIHESGVDLWIGHLQAPTTVDVGYNIHPSHYVASNGTGSWIWHNGIIKPGVIADLQCNTNVGPEFSWDTGLLNRRMGHMDCKHAASFLSTVEGSFACFWLQKRPNQPGRLFYFRNAIAPLWQARGLWSSLRWEPSGDLENQPPSPVPAGQIFEIDASLETMLAVPECTFETLNNPYNLE